MRLENPFQDPLRFERRVPDCALVIFGANGDLMRRKLLPALYRLAMDRRLPAGFAILGISRTSLGHEGFRNKMREALERGPEDSPFDAGAWDAFARGFYYLAGDVHSQDLYPRIDRCLVEIERDRGTGGNALFYLSVQPSQYAEVAEGLAAVHNPGWRRLIVEKPFGRDLASARALNARLQGVFQEEDIYRIDHYLGKETVQNILAFRFGNGVFEPLWNRGHIEHVQITAAEAIGVEGRGAYYQEAGALRDMIQNHLLQVMATVAMEPSATFRAGAVRDERAKLLRAIRVYRRQEAAAQAVRGQYQGFRQEPGVDPRARTDTFAAVTFLVDNWRWAGVPFYLRSGKRLPKRVTEVAVQFKAAPLALFNGGCAPNWLILRIQPEEGISLRFHSKRPGAGMKLRTVSMDFSYGASFGERFPSAYETLLLDAMAGDATLYTRQDMVEASWAAVDPILEAWETDTGDVPVYAEGSWGPKEADELPERRGHAWRRS